MDFARFFEDSIDLLCSIEPDGTVKQLNAQWVAHLGWSKSELTARPLSSFIHPDDRDAFLDRLQAGAGSRQDIEPLEARMQTRSGSHSWLAWSLSPLGDGLVGCTARDISDLILDRQRADQQSKFLQLATDMAEVGYWEHNPQENRTSWSDTLYSIFEIDVGDPVSPQIARAKMHPDDVKIVEKNQELAFSTGQSVEYEARLIRPNGEYKYFHTNAHCELTSDTGVPALIFGVTKDVTAHITGLANRAMFNEYLTRALARTERDGSLTALCLIDLDDFKDVNDSLGHPVGDALLKELADRMRNGLPSVDLVARLGGDEFALIQTSCTSADQVEDLCNQVATLFSLPFVIENQTIKSACSIGVSIAPNDGHSADTMLSNADIALYQAKDDGRGVFRFFEAEMDARIRTRRKLQDELVQAIPNNEFVLHYQPMFDTITQKLVSFEALLRWDSPRRGLLAPNEFVPLAEDTGLIVPIGHWVIEQACHEAARWPDSVAVSINVSAVQFKSDGLEYLIEQALASSGLDPQRLEIEITETALLADANKTIATLHTLRDRGMKIVMDDFGIGYSSLSYLRSFPFDKLKLDRSFIRGLTARPGDTAIISAVAEMARSLGIQTTSEGIETFSELALVTREGYNQIQGFLYSKPLAADQVWAEYFETNTGTRNLARVNQ